MVRVPGARQSQNDVAITSNIVLIKLVIITHSQHNHQHYLRISSVCPSFCYKFPYASFRLWLKSILRLFCKFTPLNHRICAILNGTRFLCRWLRLRSSSIDFIPLLKHEYYLYINTGLHFFFIIFFVFI